MKSIYLSLKCTISVQENIQHVNWYSFYFYDEKRLMQCLICVLFLVYLSFLCHTVEGDDDIYISLKGEIKRREKKLTTTTCLFSGLFKLDTQKIFDQFLQSKKKWQKKNKKKNNKKQKTKNKKQKTNQSFSWQFDNSNPLIFLSGLNLKNKQKNKKILS